MAQFVVKNKACGMVLNHLFVEKTDFSGLNKQV